MKAKGEGEVKRGELVFTHRQCLNGFALGTCPCTAAQEEQDSFRSKALGFQLFFPTVSQATLS